MLKLYVRKNNKSLVWRYDNLNGIIYDENNTILGEPIDEDDIEEQVPRFNPNKWEKQKTRLNKLSIFLGQNCNFKCSYCSEQFLKSANGHNAKPEDVPNFIKLLSEHIKIDPLAIDIWGGEPLVYWKTLVILLPELRRLYQTSKILIRTNGSLLNDELIDFFIKYKISISISDDLDNTIRGEDAIKNQRMWKDYNRWAKMMGDDFVFGVVINQKNVDLEKLLKIAEDNLSNVSMFRMNILRNPNNIAGDNGLYYFDDNAVLGLYNSILKMSRTKLPLKHTLVFQVREFVKYLYYHTMRDRGFNSIHGMYIDGFCDTPLGNRLHVDLLGNAFNCKLTNNINNKCGTLEDFENIKYPGFTSSLDRKYCPNCPVIQICRGVCGLATQESINNSCRQKYAFYYAAFKVAVEMAFECQIEKILPEKGEAVPTSLLINDCKEDYFFEKPVIKKIIKIMPSYDEEDEDINNTLYNNTDI